MSIPDLHDFQEAAVATAVGSITAQTAAALFVAPTGTGKTIMQASVLRRLAEARQTVLQVVPNMEIAKGFSRWLDIPFDRDLLAAAGIFTSKKLANELAAGRIDPTRYDVVQIDEAHHSVDNTHQLVDQYLGYKPRIGWTATDYRGTPKETARLYEWWGGNVHRVLGEVEAVARGFSAAPSVEVLPLVNDELIKVAAGEFSTVGIEAATEDKLEELVGWTKKFLLPDGKWDRPTMLTLSTRFLVEEAMKWFEHFGLPAAAVTGATDQGLRQSDFEDVVNRRKLLVQIKVVGEGVDLPLRRLIDAAPTLSPVFWRQRIGRIMRPVRKGCDLCMDRGDIWPGSSSWSPSMTANAAGIYICPACGGYPHEDPPEYIVTNHNLLRHGYLLRGVLPPIVFAKARQAWGEDYKPSRRMVARAVNLDGLGKFVPNEIPLADGTFWWMFVLGTPDGRKQYAALVSPAGADSIFAVREFDLEVDPGTGHRMKRYDLAPKWRRIKRLPDLTGCLSVPAPPLTPGMKRWWDRSARWKGLDPEAEVNARVFQVLPLLTDIGGKFQTGGDLR